MMDFLEKTVLRFFDQLSDPWKLILLLLLVGALIALSIWKYRGWRRLRSLRKELRRVKLSLQSVSQERDHLQKRLESLDIVDSHVWTRPDAFRNDRFVDAAGRKTRFLAFCNLKGGVGKTTLTVNLGTCLALRGRRVLLVD